TLQDVQAEADRVAIQQYAPPGVVINDAAEILHVRGRPAPYIELTPGQASLNVFKLAHPDVVSDLRYLINAARREGTPATKSNLNLKRSGSRRVFGIKVVPLRVVPPSKERYYSIFFEETLAPPLDLAPKQRGEALSKRKQRIEHRDHTAQDS